MEEQAKRMSQDCVSREKYWVECSIEEKIERMRRIVKSQEAQIDGLRQRETEMRLRFEKHAHLENVLVIIQSNSDIYGNGLIDGIERKNLNQDPNTVYF